MSEKNDECKSPECNTNITHVQIKEEPKENDIKVRSLFFYRCFYLDI